MFLWYGMYTMDHIVWSIFLIFTILNSRINQPFKIWGWWGLSLFATACNSFSRSVVFCQPETHFLDWNFRFSSYLISQTVYISLPSLIIDFDELCYVIHFYADGCSHTQAHQSCSVNEFANFFCENFEFRAQPIFPPFNGRRWGVV